MELLAHFLNFLRGKDGEANAVSSTAKLSADEKRAIPLSKLEDVVRNSAFSDLLVERFGVEFSQLSFVIESSLW